MATTLQHHQHIGMCDTGKLRNTQHAIDIFNSVVQMGLEGIVIVDADEEYGTLVDRHGDDAQLFFKLQQKIVLPWTQITQGKKIDRWKDGAEHPEHIYTMQNENNEKIEFTDEQDRKTGSYVRIKYMEHAPGMTNNFPCQSGYSHAHCYTVRHECASSGDCEIDKQPNNSKYPWSGRHQ